MLEVHELSVRVNGKEILRNVDLSIKKGEVVVLFGPNGAGKSTLLSTIAGIGGYDVRGSIRFLGEEISGLPPYERVRRGVVLAYQFPPEIEGVRVDELAKILEKRFGGSSALDIGNLAQRELFVGMSGGERKIVELYLTALTKPRLVLLDEPDSGVDVENVGRVAEQLNVWIRKGVSVLLVTHSGAILDYLERADRAIVLANGRIVCEGDVDEVFQTIVRRGYRGVGESC